MQSLTTKTLHALRNVKKISNNYRDLCQVYRSAEKKGGLPAPPFSFQSVRLANLT
jgi:hypothetical protein